MTQTPSVIAVANAFIDAASEKKESLTPLKLIKLCYIAHGLYLGFGKGELFREEVQAWKYGPVIEKLYQVLKPFKGNVIFCKLPNDENPLEQGKTEYVHSVYDAYKDFSGIQLMNLTHQAGTPWDKMYKKWSFFNTIPNDLIKSYYEDFIAKHN